MKQAKTIFLTGGTGKVGSQLIMDLNALGYNILFTSRNEGKIKEIELRYNNNTNFIKGIKVDFISDDYIDIISSFITKNKTYPNILINNCRNVDYLKVSDGILISDDNWLGEFSLGVLIPYKLTMYMALDPEISLQKVINIASIYGVVVPNKRLYSDFNKESPINYGTIKSALIHLTKELAVRLSDHDISVNAISYGGIKGREVEEFNKNYQLLCPQKRMLDEKDISGPVLFLISDSSSGITGHNLIVDGGWTIW